MKKKLTILNTSQFGTLTDSYKWCIYLKEHYDITFISFNSYLKRMDVDDVNYIYVYRFGNPRLRGLWYIIYTIFYCIFHSAPIFIVYFKYCGIFATLFPKRTHVDIRTLAVSDNIEANAKNDYLLKRTVNKFRSASFISNGVQGKLNPLCQRQYILPLGASVVSTKEKDFSILRLLYVGTLTNRNIITTVKGFDLFIRKYPNVEISYDIVGDGEDFQLLDKYIKEHNLSNYITLYGKLSYDELFPFYDKCNIGISYIPIRDYYQYQPPTKTFEYILSGLYCIATETIANTEVINNDNGVLIKDTDNAFSIALENLLIKNNLNSDIIRNSLLNKYDWRIIVENKMIPIIENIYNL